MAKHKATKIEAGWWLYRGYGITQEWNGRKREWRVLENGVWLGDWYKTVRAARTWIDTKLDG